MSRWALASCCVIACGAIVKPPEPSRRLELHTGGSVFESSAGFRFAALPEPRSGIVRLDVRYPVGSVDDPPGKEGLAHLVEHLLFDVEIERGGQKTSINAELGRLALSWNAETDTDYTTYQVVAEPAALDALLGLEVDRLARGCSALTPAIFTREREVVLNELRERQGAGGAELRQQIYNAIYPPGHPYRHGDSVETVAKLDFKDVCDFLAGPYRRGIATVVASGAVADAEFRASVEHHFATVPKRGAQQHPAPPVVAPVREVVRMKADIDEPIVAITWPLPPSDSGDARRLAMVYEAMPLFLNEKGMMFGWGHSAYATVLGGRSAPVLAIMMTVSSTAHLDDVKDSVDGALAFGLRVLGEDKDTNAWRLAWQAYAEDLLARWENLGSRNDLASTELAAGSTDLLIGRIKELANDTPNATREVAKRWLDPERARYLAIEPTGQASTVAHVARASGGEAEHLTVVDPALADQPLPAPRSSGLATTRYRLDNGLTVILWPHGTASLVHGRLVIQGGMAQDPAGGEGVTELLHASQVLEDSIVYRDREISTRVDDVVAQLAAELRIPGYDLGDEAKRVLKGRLRLRGEQEARAYEQALVTAVYGEHHPYARPLINEHSVDTIHTDMITGWARSHIVAKNSTLIIAGQFDPELVKRHIAYNLDQVSAGDRTPPVDVPLHAPETTRVFGVSSKPSPSIQLDVAFAGGSGIDSRYGARLVLEQVLTNRLEGLRGERALTYGFGATFEPRRGGGLWRISGKADASRAGEATTALLAILDEMRRDPESYRAAFVLARQKVLERLAVSENDSSAVTSRLVLLARFGLPDSFYDHVAQDVARLTLPELHGFLLHELPAENQVFGAFGDHDAVTAARAAAK
ncbi:MAG TPA: insulinase family protein [Kofleriaceae bacterium]|nr:insulinase family protein [Kofleriaceae bacterium]